MKIKTLLNIFVAKYLDSYTQLFKNYYSVKKVTSEITFK